MKRCICLLAILCMIPVAAWADGGPNLFGYVWSKDVDLTWIDTATGTVIALSDDDYEGPFPLGFSFFFYGQEKTEFSVGSNGLLGLGSTSSLSSTSNQCPLVATNPNDVILLYWDDLNPATGGGEVRSYLGGTEPYRHLVIEFDSVVHFGTSDPLTAQVVLMESADAVLLQFQDASSERGSGATTGIKNVDGTDNLQVGCNAFGYLKSGDAFWIGLQGPHDLDAGPGTGTIHLSWTDDFDNEDGTLAERSVSAFGPFTEIGQAGPGERTFDDDAAQECSTYWYRVRSHFGATYFGPYSNLVDYAFPPYGPTDLEAEPMTATRIDLTWTDNSDCELAFIVQRTEIEPGGWAEVAELDADLTFWSDETVMPGVPYRYRVKAVAPPLESAYSNEASVIAKLEPPSDLEATAFSETSIDLVWVDNTVAEDGFAIERKGGQDDDFVEIANVGFDVTAFADFDLQSATAYVYRVRSYSLLTFSDYSNEADATTAGDDDDDDDGADDDDGGDDDDDDDDDEACCG